MVGSQIGNLTPKLSFGHNLCVKCANGAFKPILNIEVPKAFQWCKELHNLMGFGPCNCFLKIWESIETPTPKMGAHLGVRRFIPSHSPTLPGFLLGLHLCKPKARVVPFPLWAISNHIIMISNQQGFKIQIYNAPWLVLILTTLLIQIHVIRLPFNNTTQKHARCVAI